MNLSFLAGKAWTPELIKRVYFGNWLRDYAQLIDYSTLQHADKDTYRLVVRLLLGKFERWGGEAENRDIC